MRNLVVCAFVIALVSCNTQAQTDDFQKFFKKYEEKDGITIVNIANSVQVLAVEDDALNESINFYNELLPLIKSGKYSQFMNIKEKDQNVVMLTDTSTGEFYIIVGGKDNAVIRMADGTDFEEIAAILEDYNVDVNIGD